MIASLLALAITSQSSSTVQLGTVDVGGQQIPVEVPATRGPFDENTPHIEIDGWKFKLDEYGNVGVRYKSDGGWGEVADAYPIAAQKSVAAPEYRIKVIVLTNATILERGHDKVWRRRRGAILEGEKLTILKSLARLKALAETAAEGRVRLTFDVSYDDDLLFKKVEPGDVRGSATSSTHISLNTELNSNVLLGSEFIKQDIAPRISNDPYENEEGLYNGPYSSVFVIHPARTSDNNISLIERTPVTTVSWTSFTESEPGASLSLMLFNAWRTHLNLAVLAHNGQSVKPPFQLKITAPNVFEHAISDVLLTQGNHLNSAMLSDSPSWGVLRKTDFSAEDAKELKLSKLPQGYANHFKDYAGQSVSFGFIKMKPLFSGYTGDRNIVFVPPVLASRFMTANPEAKAIGVARVEDTRAINELIGYEVPETLSRKTDLEVLNVDKPTAAMISTQPVAAQSNNGEVDFAPTGHGNFDVAFVEDPVEGRTLEVSEHGIARRGYVTLASSEGAGSLFKVTTDTALKFKASCDLPDAFVLQLHTSDHNQTNISLFGESHVPAEAQRNLTVLDINASRQPGPFWTEFKIKLPPDLYGLDVTEIRLAPPEFAGYYERISVGKKSLKISKISFGPMSEIDPETVPTMNADIEWLINVDGSLDESETQRMTGLLRHQSHQIRLNALGAMTRIKSEELLPEIAVHLNSIDESEAYLAFQAMKRIDTELAWANIAYVTTKGPMGHNYRFAAEAMAEKPEPATVQLMNGLMLNRNWRTRRAAAQTFGAVDTEAAGIIASITLTSDPSPLVRYAVTKQKRPNHELFARRLLWTAVNDPSEWVRASGYLALLDSQFEDIRNQAIRGVRDDSVTIKLALLKAMKESPQAHYRPGLQFAVVDASPFVRAAALRAFATQPGHVVPGEIQNTFTDDHPAVKQALAELAQAKNITLPPSQ